VKTLLLISLLVVNLLAPLNAYAESDFHAVFDANTGESLFEKNMKMGARYFLNGEYEKAVGAYTRATSLEPSNPKGWYEKGAVLFYFLKKWEASARCFRKATRLDPGNARAWLLRGKAESEAGQDENAIASFDKALKLNPRDSDAWFGKGLSLCKLQRQRESLECFDEVIKLKPDDSQKTIAAWGIKGASLEVLGEYGMAVECYDGIIEITPEAPLAWYGKGLALVLMGELVPAAECFIRAASLDDDLIPVNEEYFPNTFREYSEGIKRSLAANPDNCNAWLSNALVLCLLGRADESSESFNQAVLINPEIESSETAKSLIKIGFNGNYRCN